MTPAALPDRSLSTLDRLGDYKLGQVLGRGGMGEVWSATKVGMGGFLLPCAIKVMRREYAQRAKDRQRFLQEALITARLTHKNIVKIHDFGESMGLLYLAMERIDGIDLRGFMSTLRLAGPISLPVPLVLHIIAEILAALSHAHGHKIDGSEQGVIHHDVTSGNVMISSSGDVKLMDFGIARVTGEGEPAQKEFAIGTPRYMAPERILGHSRRESDLYSVGVLVHELLSGTPYHEDCTPGELKRRALLDPPPPIQREDVPAGLDALRGQLLSTTPEHRPSADEALEVIEELLLGHGRARRELARLYQRHVAPPSSGMTGFVNVGTTKSASATMLPQPKPEATGQGSALTKARGADARPGPVRRGLRWLLRRPAPPLTPQKHAPLELAPLKLAPLERGQAVTASLPSRQGGPTCPLNLQRAGEAYDGDWHVLREQAERYALDNLSRAGSPVAISAPLHFGKSWLVCRLVQQLREQQPRSTVVHLDLDTVDLDSLETLLSSMLRQIAQGVGLEIGEIDELWPSYGTPQHRFMTALETHVRPHVNSTLVLALDLPDRMWEFSRRDDFFGIMRALSGQADPERWRWIRVLMAFSMSTALYIEDTARSPWNVPEVQLDEFDRAQIEGLVAAHGLDWGAAEIDELHAWVGGHPYLVRAIMHDAKRDAGTLAGGLQGDGVRAHLGQVEALLARDESLCASLVDAVASKKISIGHRRRLEAAGLLRWDRGAREYILRFPVYAEMIARLS